MTDEVVHASRGDGVLTVVIDRPAVRNAIDARTARELAAAFREFDADDSLHVAVLTGSGSTFCRGRLERVRGGQRGSLESRG